MNALVPKPGHDTPQRLAAVGRHLPILQLFLEKGVQPDLFMAAALGLTDIVEAHLAANPKDFEAKGAHGVVLMSHVNHVPMAELLIKHGADPTAALAQLAWSGNVQTMLVALSHGGKVNEPAVGRRPLHIAAARGHLAVVEMLLAAGAEPHARAKGAEWEAKTPLALAIMNNHTAVVEFLRKKAPPPTQPPRIARPMGRPGGSAAPGSRGHFRGGRRY